MAFGSLISCMTDIIVTLLPEPDSPTMPSTSPSSTVSETPSTAFTTPSSVRKLTWRSLTSSRAIDGSLGGADPRVEPCVQNVDDRVREHDEDGAVDDGGHDHRQIEPGQRVVREVPDPVEVEHDLDEQRAPGHEDAEVQAEETDEGDQRRPERVPEHHALFRDPLRPRSADVVLALGLDQVRAQ